MVKKFEEITHADRQSERYHRARTFASQTAELVRDFTWHELTERLGPGDYLVVHAADPGRRRAARWNGFM